jgi:hypothetical protein
MSQPDLTGVLSTHSERLSMTVIPYMLRSARTYIDTAILAYFRLWYYLGNLNR